MAASAGPGQADLQAAGRKLALIPLCLAGLVAAAVPVLILIGLTTGGSDDSRPTLTVGSCARNSATWPEQDLQAVNCGSTEAQFKVTEPPGGTCADGDYIAYPEYSKDGDISLCLHPLR
ncbi:hypothetical protein ACGFYV_27170 [Streptomyces sp. NPDC048297]|uniref:LppU/SCO3897 family protein n=1 Tax=Streptomyces sp. NPDC048297 TaxID=3365531 RepID=UPI00371F482F